MTTNDSAMKPSAASSPVGADLRAARGAEPLPAPSEPAPSEREAVPLPESSKREAVPLPARPEVGPCRARPSRLWLWFVAAFLIQAVAWTAWFVIASKNRVQEVPLANSGKR